MPPNPPVNFRSISPLSGSMPTPWPVRSGSGALFARKDRLGDIRLTYFCYGAFDPHGFVVPPEGSPRFEMGEMYNPTIRAFNVGLTWIRDEATFAWAQTRIANLGQKTRSRVGGNRWCHRQHPA